jgi:hypothetical protein
MINSLILVRHVLSILQQAAMPATLRGSRKTSRLHLPVRGESHPMIF